MNMFSFLTKEEGSQRKVIRTITTSRGTEFAVFAESEHYVFCHEPQNKDTPQEAINDLEELAQRGYFYLHSGMFMIAFEKRGAVD